MRRSVDFSTVGVFSSVPFVSSICDPRGLGWPMRRSVDFSIVDFSFGSSIYDPPVYSSVIRSQLWLPKKRNIYKISGTFSIYDADKA
jgi:hypothetical protein